MATNTGTCPNCQQINSINSDSCIECGAALPWAGIPAMVSVVTKQQSASSSYEAVGLNGQVEVLADRIRIKRSGGWALITQGLKGDKDILISSLSSVQFKRCGTMTNGYIQFAFHGGQESKMALMNAGADENTVMFTAAQQPAFERLKDIVDEKQSQFANRNSAPAVAAPSELDQIEKLASLRDRGIITEDEFNAKKKQLLGI